MIFILGGLVILVISFVVALVSLFREQKEHNVADDAVETISVHKPKPIIETTENKPEQTSDTISEKTDEEVKLANREEAFRILQSRVQKMTESEAAGEMSDNSVGDSVMDIQNQKPTSWVNEAPETNIEDPLEADIAASEKVPFPWEEKGDQAINIPKQESTIMSDDQTNPAQNHLSESPGEDEDKQSTSSNKQSTFTNKQSTSSNKQSFSANKLSGQINLEDLKKDE